MVDGVHFLEQVFPDFVEVYNLEQDFGGGSDCSTSPNPQDMCSAGLPRQGATPGRVRSDLYLMRVTDERVPDDGKKFFVFTLSIHGIERAGAEGGVRAAEDLATWAYCESKAGGTQVSTPAAPVNCDNEGASPHPIMETATQQSVKAGDALRTSAIYFVFANPDGWRRGDKDNLVTFYQRYNGNGVDLNRDWPSEGFVYRPYTPWSEPESRSIGRVLKSIRTKWDGGIDLHGQVVDRAFSFTMLPQGQADHGKTQRILQIARGAWADAEKRLGWSPIIIPNGTPQNCEPTFVAGSLCDRMYGVQWGTVWDTIGYTTTGAMSDWMSFDIGLGADSLGNEMSFSHLSNCGTGTCYEPMIEQMHIDGNKSLIYGMINFTHKPEDQSFRVPGKVAYVFNPNRVENPGRLLTPAATEGLNPQPQIMDVSLSPSNNFTYAFDINGPNQGFYNGGVEGKATPAAQAGGSSASSLITAVVLEMYGADEDDPGSDEGCGADGDDWSEVNRYYNQGLGYMQSGQAVHANDPVPGRYRICVTGDFTPTGGSAAVWDLDITFTTEKAWEDPGQRPYSVTNMKFFEDLVRFMEPGQMKAVTVDDVLAGRVNLSSFDSLIIADDPFPGFVEPRPTGPAQPKVSFDPGSKTSQTIPCFYDPEFGGLLLPQCVADFEFESKPEFNNQSMTVRLEYPLGGGWSLVVERETSNDRWQRVGYSNSYSGIDEVSLTQPDPGLYRARIINSGGGTDPTRLEVTFSDAAKEGPSAVSQRTSTDLSNWATKLKDFVQAGGNLVLTDGALKGLAYMGLIDSHDVNRIMGYAGLMNFSSDGESSTYDDPLAQGLNIPGAAEGDGFRHQTYEPIPIGFAIPDDRDPFSGFAPNWTIAQAAWEKAGGRTVGTTGIGNTSLGELKVGQGTIRIIGALVPMPTEEHYHPFGLANYSVTYSGYQLLANALKAPAKVAGVRLAATGPAEGPRGFAIQGVGLAALIFALWSLRLLGTRLSPRGFDSLGQKAGFAQTVASRGPRWQARVAKRLRFPREPGSTR